VVRFFAGCLASNEIKIAIRIKIRTVGGAAVDNPNVVYFGHEKLEVYRETIRFIACLSTVLEGADRLGNVKDQLDRASTSIVLNIAEGNGKFAPKDRCRFFDIALGSTMECAAGLDVVAAKGK